MKQKSQTDGRTTLPYLCTYLSILETAAKLLEWRSYPDVRTGKARTMGSDIHHLQKGRLALGIGLVMSEANAEWRCKSFCRGGGVDDEEGEREEVKCMGSCGQETCRRRPDHKAAAAAFAVPMPSMSYDVLCIHNSSTRQYSSESSSEDGRLKKDCDVTSAPDCRRQTLTPGACVFRATMARCWLTAFV